MKARTLILSVVAAAMTFGMGRAVAATNEVSTLLQKGLFEEEANHNLDAAIKAYQAVVTQTDKDRQFAATAVFRLGECYRKQGNTNAAAVQYQRILREFADQPELAKLSREQLGPGASLATGGIADRRLADELRAMSPEKRRVAVQQKFPNPVLNSLMEKMVTTEQELAGMKGIFGVDHQDVKHKTAVLKSIYQQIDDQVDGVLEGLKTTNLGDGGVITGSPAGKKLADELRAMSPEKRRAAVQQLFPNPTITSLMHTIATTEQEIDTLKKIAATDLDVMHKTALVKDMYQQIDDQVDGVIERLSGPSTVTLDKDLGAARKRQEAAEQEEINRLKVMIRDNPDLINAYNGENTPLLSAIRTGQPAVVKFLLENQADPDLKQNGGNHSPPVVWAAILQDKEIVEQLLQHGANISATDENRKTALHWAAERGYKIIAETLLVHKAGVDARDKDGRTPLRVAAEKGFRSMAELLAAQGADVNSRDNNGVTPLQSAASEGNKAIVEWLLVNKANPNIGDGQGWTPLTASVRFRKLEIARTLLDHGADVEVQKRGDHTRPLHFAVEYNWPDGIKLLLEHHADVNAMLKDNEGKDTITPLILAANSKYDEAARLLIDAKADVNQRGPSGETALMAAIGQNDTNLITLLLDNHANPNLGTSYGETPLNRAAIRNEPIPAAALLAHGADVNAPDKYGQTPLHHAASANATEMVDFLVAHGADVNAKNNSGKTPLDLIPNPPPAGGNYTRPLGVPNGQTPQIAYQWWNDKDSGSPAGGITNAMTILRAHGGVSDIELSTIRVARRGSAARVVLRSNNSFNNPATLFEAIAIAYAAPTNATVMRSETGYYQAGNREEAPGLRFPDFDQIRIRRVQSDGRLDGLEIPGLGKALATGDCSADRLLRWGDVVEIPEADHKIDEPWLGLTANVRATLVKCLQRNVEIAVKGQSAKTTLLPRTAIFEKRFGMGGVIYHFQPPSEPMTERQIRFFGLNDVIRNANVILASSDLTQVKVRRMDTATGKKTEMTFNLEKTDPETDLLLKDGDVVEIPEKPGQ